MFDPINSFFQFCVLNFSDGVPTLLAIILAITFVDCIDAKSRKDALKVVLYLFIIDAFVSASSYFTEAPLLQILSGVGVLVFFFLFLNRIRELVRKYKGNKEKAPV